MKNTFRFKIVFKDRKTTVISAFNGEQAAILASAARIQAGEAPLGFEHRIREIRSDSAGLSSAKNKKIIDLPVDKFRIPG